MTEAPPPVVRDSRDEDVPAIQAIYAHHVLHGFGSFEEVPPDLAEMARRRQGVLAARLPYLVAESADEILGYAYASPFRPRTAYRFTVENSIYVAENTVGRGIGRVLLDVLIRRCTEAGARQMIAIIGDSGNSASIGLHARAGFQHVGILRSVGLKKGRWVDIVTMQRALGEGDDSFPVS